MEDRLKGLFVVNMYCLLGDTSAHTKHRHSSIVKDISSSPHTCTGVPLIRGMLAAHALAPLYIQL